MAYVGNQTIEVDIQIQLNGVVGHTVLQYGTQDVGEYTSPESFLNAFDFGVTNDLKAMLSSAATLVGYRASTTNPTGVPPFPPFFYAIGASGDVAGEALPPYAAYRLYKIPDNVNIEGTLTDPFRNGMCRVMGVPEGLQAQGILSGAAVTLLNAFGESLESFQTSYGGFVGTQWDLLMIRWKFQPPPTQAGVAPVLETVGSAILGTQNTRKYAF